MSAPPLSLAAYAAATRLLEPLAPALLRARARDGKEDPKRLPERLGRAGCARPPGPLVWLHAVSVGEALSLLPLIAAIQARRPELSLLVTTGTRTAAELLANRLPPGVIHQFAPVDSPGAVRRFLDHWRPGTALQVESELWPNLILGAKARGVRQALLSARITEQSVAGWARAPAAARAVLGAFELILPQDEATAGRLTRLGAAPGPRLNLKLAGAAPPHDPAELERLRSTLGGRKVVLAASTHPGEERPLAEALLRAAPEALLIVAPRHPDRGDAVAQDLAEAGFQVARRSRGEALGGATSAYVADTLGELGLFYRLADLVVMGGSFVAGIGGHNPMEAARVGAPLVTGPHVANAEDVYAEMRVEGAAVQVPDVAALADEARRLLADPAAARRLGEAALAFAGRQGAALEAAMHLIEPLLPA